MKTVAAPLSRLPLVSRSTLAARFGDVLTLMKPRVMMLAVFTALVGLACAPRGLDTLDTIVAVLAIGAGAGATGVLNMWYDADIDAVMTRTAYPPLSELQFSPGVGVDYYLWSLQISGIGTLLTGVNFVTTILKMRAPGMGYMRMTVFYCGSTNVGAKPRSGAGSSASISPSCRST